MVCDEQGESCVGCDVLADGDGDGHHASACGGDDCDDGDPGRYPGNAEVCDRAARDEDCDATTIGERDADGDGAIDAACCNVSVGGDRLCGTDCDDTSLAVRPSQAEVCDGRDNDCDGAVDEETSAVLWYLDADGDAFGRAIDSQPSCAPLAGRSLLGTDCDDGVASVHPGASETCNLRDDDCDRAVDEEITCADGGVLDAGPVMLPVLSRRDSVPVDLSCRGVWTRPVAGAPYDYVLSFNASGQDSFRVYSDDEPFAGACVGTCIPLTASDTRVRLATQSWVTVHGEGGGYGASWRSHLPVPAIDPDSGLAIAPFTPQSAQANGDLSALLLVYYLMRWNAGTALVRAQVADCQYASLAGVRLRAFRADGAEIVPLPARYSPGPESLDLGYTDREGTSVFIVSLPAVGLEQLRLEAWARLGAGAGEERIGCEVIPIEPDAVTEVSMLPSRADANGACL